MIKKWFIEFSCSHANSREGKRLGHLMEAITPDIVDKIHGMIWGDRKLKVYKLGEVVGISTEQMHHIWHEYMQMKRLGVVTANDRP